MTTSSYVIVAKITGVHGIKGHVKLLSFTEPPENIVDFKRFFILSGQNWQPLDISDFQIKGQNIVAILNNIKDRDEARIFNGRSIAVLREDLPKIDNQQDGYYWVDLEGLAVYNRDNKLLGHVSSVFNTGANDILSVKSSDKEILIPYVSNKYIISVDLDNKKIIVDWEEDW